MMGQNRKRLTNRPRYNPRIESPDFLLTNSVSSSFFESSSALLQNGSRNGESTEKKQQGRSEVTQKLRNRPSDPASRQRDAIETYIRRYVTSANSKRPKEDDEMTTQPRVRLTDNVKIVFDEDRYRKSLSTTPSPESSIAIRNFSSIHHIADHKRSVCDETFRNRFSKPETRKDERKFDVKRVLSEGIEQSNIEENDNGRHILISKALGKKSNMIENTYMSSLRHMTTQDEHVKNLLRRMTKSCKAVARDSTVCSKRNAWKSEKDVFRINGMSVSVNEANYDEFARDFSEFLHPHQIEGTTEVNHMSTNMLDFGPTRNKSMSPDDNHISGPTQNHNCDSSLALPSDTVLSSNSLVQIVKGIEKPKMVTGNNGITSKIEESKSEKTSESSLRIALRIPSAENPEVTNRFDGHPVVQVDNGLSFGVSDSDATKNDPCLTCPMCVAQREMEEIQKTIKDESFIRPDSFAAACEEDEVMDFRSSGIFHSRPSLPPSVPEGVELKHVKAYDITSLGEKFRFKPEHTNDKSKESKTDYRLSLRDVKKENSSSTSPSTPKSGENTFHLQGTELQPRDRFSLISESAIAGFPTQLGKQYSVPEFRPSPIYSPKWVVEKSSPSRLSSNSSNTAHPTNLAGVSGKTIGVSVPHHDSIENEIMNVRIPFLIWRNKQKKENIANIKDNCKVSTITLDHRHDRPGSSPSSKASGGGEDRTKGNQKLTMAEQALLSQRAESDRKTAFPCPPNSPAPEQLVDLVHDLQEGREESLTQSRLQDSTCADGIQV